MFGMAKKSAILFFLGVSTMIFILMGGILIAFSYRVSGRGDRSRGTCTITGGQVVYISGTRGGGFYRPVYRVNVFALGSTATYQSNAAAFEGDMSSEATYSAGNAAQRAQDALASKPVGSTVNCLYPDRGADYPYGFSLFDGNAAFVGDYSDSEIEAAKSKFKGMNISGIVFVVFGGMCGLLLTGILLRDCLKN